MCKWCRAQPHHKERADTYARMLTIALQLGDDDEIRVLQACHEHHDGKAA